MAKELLWSKDTVILNRTLDDSLDLLFCQDLKKTNVFEKQVQKEKGIKRVVKFIKDIC